MKKIVIKLLAQIFAFFSVRKKNIPENPRKILILMCNWIGDTFWALQVIPELKRKYPEAQFYAGIKPFSKPLLFNLIEEENIIILKNVISDRKREKLKIKDYFHELEIIRSLKFDILLDLTCNPYSAIFSWLSGSDFTLGVDCHMLSPLYSLNATFDTYPALHLSFRPWTVIEPLIGHQKDIKLFPVATAYQLSDIKKEFSMQEGKKTALLLPGAGWATKQWPGENFVETGKRFEREGWLVVVSGNEKERFLCEKISSELNSALLFIQPLEKLISLLPGIDAVVSCDSGIAHLAAAFGIDTYVLFCPTNPNYCRPIGKNVHVFRNKACPYLPTDNTHHCINSIHPFCPRTEWMKISPEEIYSASKGIVSS